MEYYAQDSADALKSLGTSLKGLSSEEVAARQKKYGANALEKEERTSPLKILLEQFTDPFILMLFFAAVLSVVTSSLENGFSWESYIEGFAILVIILFSVIMGFIQEYRAEKALRALEKMSALKAKVLRNGEESIIEASELVPGDIIILEEGSIVPADARILEEHSLQTGEASLTGESVPSKKSSHKLKPGIIINEQMNMVFMNTTVTYGKATAVVTCTGMSTEIGKIAKSIQTTEETKTPLQEKLTQLAKTVSKIIFVLIAIVFFAGLVKGKADIPSMLVFAISLAVAAVPNSLPLIITVGLSLGAKRLAGKNMLVKKLHAAESLGSVTIICSDKTGTLTKNEMTVKKIFADYRVIDVSGTGYDTAGEFSFEGKSFNPKNIEALLRVGYLCNNAKLVKNGNSSIIGDPTEGSLKVLGEKGGFNEKTAKKFSYIDELPFDSDRKMMSVVYENGRKREAYVKGAPDLLLKKCSMIFINGKLRKLTDKDRKEILSVNEGFAKEALRVLGFACREMKKGEKIEIKSVEKNLVFLGLAGMIDPQREEVKSAIEQCISAGIKVMMITGDHAATAKAVGAKIGLYSEGDLVLTGEDIDKMNDKQLEAKIDSIKIIARALPIQKLRIVDALKKNGHVVAMTGDGVNDAPALKKADIGIAMGITGTDVSKEVAKATLVDDNFATIVNAIEEGRNIYDKLIKSVRYLLSCNSGEIVSVFIAIMLNFPLPMIPLQLLMMNLLTDNFPALGLGVEPPDKNIMKRPPRNPNESPLTRDMGILIVVYGVLMGLITFAMFSKYEQQNLELARTVAFTTLVIFEMFATFSSRSLEPSLSKLNPFTNLWLLTGVIASVVLQIIVIYWAPMQKIFQTVPLSGNTWIEIVGVSFVGFLMMEVGKFILSERNKKANKISSKINKTKETAA